MKFIELIGLIIAILVISLPITFAETLSLQYDANGNLVTGDGKFRIYNSLNQLTKVYNGTSESGTLLEELTYHPIEERILTKKTYNSSGTLVETVIYIDENFVRVVNLSGSYDFTYVKHEGQLVGQKNPDGSKYFIHGDHLGSATIVTNEVGTILENTSYTPYGEILTGGVVSRFDYTGKEYSSVVGDYDFNARKYKAEWGIFLQPDKTLPSAYDPQQLNRYTYTRNNPYNFVDPTGKAAIWIHYQETKANYIAAGFSEAQASRVAAGAIEPDLYRVAQSANPIKSIAGKVAALSFNLDLQMNHVADAEQFYHSYDTEESGPLAGVSPEEHIKKLLKEYNDAVKAGDLETMGNLEHPLGHDIGTLNVPGYHAGSTTFNQIQNLHNINDLFGNFVNKEALQKEQVSRAQGAYSRINDVTKDSRPWWQRFWGGKRSSGGKK